MGCSPAKETWSQPGRILPLMPNSLKGSYSNTWPLFLASTGIKQAFHLHSYSFTKSSQLQNQQTNTPNGRMITGLLSTTFHFKVLFCFSLYLLGAKSILRQLPLIRPCTKLFGASELFSFRHSKWFLRFVKEKWFKKECK